MSFLPFKTSVTAMVITLDNGSATVTSNFSWLHELGGGWVHKNVIRQDHHTGFEPVSLSNRRETPLQQGHSYSHLRGEPNSTGEGYSGKLNWHNTTHQPWRRWLQWLKKDYFTYTKEHKQKQKLPASLNLYWLQFYNVFFSKEPWFCSEQQHEYWRRVYSAHFLRPNLDQVLQPRITSCGKKPKQVAL